MSGVKTDTVLWRRWLRQAERRPDREAIVHVVAGEPSWRWTWGRLIDRASRYAAILEDRGILPGQVCALVLRHHKEFYPIYMAIEALGALPAVLAYPNKRLHPDKFRQGLEGMSVRSGLDCILTEKGLEPIIRPLATRAGSTIGTILFPLEWGLDEAAVGGGDVAPPLATSPSCPCLLQHSSGTTGLQKPVMLSHRAVLEQVDRYGRAISLGDDDKICSWLPLYHDMGLMAAFHMPLAAGITAIQIDPFEWVLAPVLLLETISSEKGTLSWMPNFAYNHMATTIRDEDLQGLSLDSIRLLINCAEPIRSASHEIFFRRFGPLGLRRTSLGACYAMAEATFAVTQTDPQREAPVLKADRNAVSEGRFVPPTGSAPVRECVSSGRPIDGCDLRIVDEQRLDLPDGQIGEIAIRSVSLFDGYRNNLEETAKVMDRGWYLSGDYGFLMDGQLYVVGRKKDLIVAAGRNIYPEDVEDAIGLVEGVCPGRIVAFGVDDEVSGTEQIGVIAETDLDDDESRGRLKRAVVEAGMSVDMTIARVYLVPPRWLIKSSAGKPSRATNRDRALAELRPVE